MNLRKKLVYLGEAEQPKVAPEPKEEPKEPEQAAKIEVEPVEEPPKKAESKPKSTKQAAKKAAEPKKQEPKKEPEKEPELPKADCCAMCTNYHNTAEGLPPAIAAKLSRIAYFCSLDGKSIPDGDVGYCGKFEKGETE